VFLLAGVSPHLLLCHMQRQSGNCIFPRIYAKFTLLSFETVPYKGQTLSDFPPVLMYRSIGWHPRASAMSHITGTVHCLVLSSISFRCVFETPHTSESFRSDHPSASRFSFIVYVTMLRTIAEIPRCFINCTAIMLEYHIIVKTENSENCL